MNPSANLSAKARTRLLANITLAKLALALPALLGGSLATPPRGRRRPRPPPSPSPWTP